MPREYHCVWQDAEKVRQHRSRLESILNVAQRLRLRCFHRLGLADSLFEHPAWLNVELWPEEIAMKKSKGGILFFVGLLAMVGLLGCNQSTPAEKTKAAAASGSAATQAAGQAAVDAIKTPMDKARQTESTLEQSAEQTAAKIKESTQ
jgi:hypothetical protein